MFHEFAQKVNELSLLGKGLAHYYIFDSHVNYWINLNYIYTENV